MKQLWSVEKAHLRTTWSLAGWGAMLPRRYWYTSVRSFSVSTTRASSRSSSHWCRSLRTWVKTSSGDAGTSTVAFHRRRAEPSGTYQERETVM